MKLIPVDQVPLNDLRYMVRSISVSKIFYVWTGRNAWWSTWATRYSPGCFHTSLQSAKTFCESKRVQGTVFYIDELPSLIFHAPDRVLVASEINTDNFLSRLNKLKLTLITTALPVSSLTLYQIRCLLRPQSTLWPNDYPKSNSMLLSFGSGSAPLESVSSEDNLVSYSSYGEGSNYMLGWNQRPFATNRKTLHAIASVLEGRLGAF